MNDVIARAMQGIAATPEEAAALAGTMSLDDICEAADEVRRLRCGDTIDTCSIINARAGLCSEDCKWCSQARRWGCTVEHYPYVDEEECMQLAHVNDDGGVRRFSLVTSGRTLTDADVTRFCNIYRRLGNETGLSLCASMGLLTESQLQQLYDAGVRRYHCNLETSARFFPTLCTTHTRADKLATIEAARRVGMEVCSGGIIGMGEELLDRLMLVDECRRAGAVSIPVNLLNPIPGTPLEHQPLLSEEEIILSVALMRFVAPDTVMRFAGGRLRLSERATRRILRGGMNGVMIGDLLTTAGSDREGDARYTRTSLADL